MTLDELIALGKEQLAKDDFVALSPLTLLPLLCLLKEMLEKEPWFYDQEGVEVCFFGGFKCQPFRRGRKQGEPYLTFQGSPTTEPPEIPDTPEKHTKDCPWSAGQSFLGGGE